MTRGLILFVDDAAELDDALARIDAAVPVAVFARSQFRRPERVCFFRVRQRLDWAAMRAAVRAKFPGVDWRWIDETPSEAGLLPRRADDGGSVAVVTCHYNFAGFDAPRRNLMRFLREMEREGVSVYGLEIVQGDGISMTEDLPTWKVVRVDDRYRLWQKEAAINAVVATLPPEVGAVAMIDADVSFDEVDWVARSLSLLSEHPAVQPFAEAVWTDRMGRIELTRPSAATVPGAVDWRRHPGFAWVIRRDFWTRGPGLYPYCITGAGDVVLATGLACASADELPKRRVGARNIALARRWHAATRRWMGAGTVAPVPGRLWHEWHGDRSDRRYEDRHAVMGPLEVEGVVEIDEHGLLRWTAEAPEEARRVLSEFFSARKEDG